MSQTLYEILGGEQPLKNLVDSFYQVMDTEPEVKELRAIHAQDLTSANEKLFEFLSGWLGGPSLFIKKYGHPRLRARHLPFAIGERERDQWLLCMARAIQICQTPQAFNDEFFPSIAALADHMRNQNSV